jgi:hypothetical protein
MIGVAPPAALLAILSASSRRRERVLLETFGDRHRDYRRRSPARFLPRPPFPVVTGFAIDWRRGLRKEHGTMFAAVTTAIVLEAAEELARMGSAAWRWREPALLTAWLGVAVLWAAVRHLKHTGRLNDLSSAPSSAVPSPEVPVGEVAP